MLLQTPAASSYHRVVIGSLNHFLCWNARNQDHTCSAALSEPIYLVIRDQSENGATNPAGGIRRCYRPSTTESRCHRGWEASSGLNTGCSSRTSIIEPYRAKF